MTKQQREELKQLKQDANQIKSRLIDLMRNVQQLSPSQAEKLGQIIGRLEHWQHQ